jgi:hypothetical protein
MKSNHRHRRFYKPELASQPSEMTHIHSPDKQLQQLSDLDDTLDDFF